MYSLNLELKSTIIYEIEHVFGRRVVSSRDCLELSDDIFNKTKQQLNSNTLRRFFSLVKAKYPPSQSTLTILSKYCGFQSIDDIYKIKNTETFETGNLNPDTVLHFFVSIFKDTVISNGEDHTFISMVMQAIKFLNSNKFLTDRFQSMIAKTDHGKKYYFEKLVNVDKLNSFYGNGLRYYLKEAGTREAEVFTTSLYVLKYWLSNEKDKLVKSADNILFAELDERFVHPFVSARRLAAMLFYNNINGLDNEGVRDLIHAKFSLLEGDASKHRFLYMFSYLVSEALLLTGFAGDALFYIEQTRKVVATSMTNGPDAKYMHQYVLIEAYALFEQSQKRAATKLFDTIKSSEFSFLSRRFSCILYLSLMKKLKPKDRSEKYEQQHGSMIKETGFKMLTDF